MYREALAAFNAGANVLTGGGLRAIVEALCKENDNLQKKIDAPAHPAALGVRYSPVAVCIDRFTLRTARVSRCRAEW